MAMMRGALGNWNEVSSSAGGWLACAGAAGVAGFFLASVAPSMVRGGLGGASALLHASASTKSAHEAWAARSTSATRNGHLRGTESGRGHRGDESQFVRNAVDALEHRVQRGRNRDFADRKGKLAVFDPE